MHLPLEVPTDHDLNHLDPVLAVMIRDLDHIVAAMRLRTDHNLYNLYPKLSVILRWADHDPNNLDRVLAVLRYLVPV